jgi:signal transduction histidine kinase
MATSFVLCVLGGVLRVDGSLGMPTASSFFLAVVSAGVLPLRHHARVGTFAITVGCGVLVAPLDLLLTPAIVAPALVAAYAFAVHADHRLTSVILLPAAALLVTLPPLVEVAFSWEDVSRLVTVAAAVLVAGLLGQSVQARRAYLSAVEERARRAESTRDSEARWRVEEERVRIARELHDLVAHQITLANAQAMVATQLFDIRRDEARASLHNVVETTSQALDDLRSTVGLLREPEDADLPEPAPGLARLPALLESFRRAGLHVSVREQGVARPLPPGLDLTAYRIVQEALTNVTKHAGTGSARISFDWHRDRVMLTVADDGPVAQLPASGRPAGFGLIGMRERAVAVGGQLSAGRRPEGGFIVSTELPLPAMRNSTDHSDQPNQSDRDDGGK